MGAIYFSEVERVSDDSVIVSSDSVANTGDTRFKTIPTNKQKEKIFRIKYEWKVKLLHQYSNIREKNREKI